MLIIGMGHDFLNIWLVDLKEDWIGCAIFIYLLFFFYILHVFGADVVVTTGLHGLKIEARIRSVPRSSDLTRAAQLNLEPEPDPNPKYFPPPTTNSQ